MHEALRGSTIVRIVRHSRVAALFTKLRQIVSRRRSTAQQTDDGSEASESPDANEAADESETPASSSVVAGSLLVGLFARLVGWIEGSWLYRWLTAEPDPDVIVIDLRDTWIVGPILTVLDRILNRFSTTGDSSLLASGVRRGYHLTVARPIQVLSALLGGFSLALVAVLIAGGSESVPLFAVAVVLALCAAVGSRITWSWDTVRETRPIKLLVAAFEPPEPPEGQAESDDQPGESSDED
jgi:hypothetical protein